MLSRVPPGAGAASVQTKEATGRSLPSGDPEPCRVKGQRVTGPSTCLDDRLLQTGLPALGLPSSLL